MVACLNSAKNREGGSDYSTALEVMIVMCEFAPNAMRKKGSIYIPQIGKAAIVDKFIECV